jgi:hypothetical protein
MPPPMLSAARRAHAPLSRHAAIVG